MTQDIGYEEWYLKTSDSTDLYVRELGSGKDTVIIVHGGFGANHDYLLDAIEGLETQYHFVLYDQRGSLMSPAPESKLTFPKNVDDLHRLITELKLNKAKIICHSMGTLVGMEYLRLHPDRVSNLVLIGALPAKADTIGGSSIFSKRYMDQLDYLTKRKEVIDL
ncbi:MAG: alpha/beta fold hydrolase, partial [Bacteroidia bacterium]